MARQNRQPGDGYPHSEVPPIAASTHAGAYAVFTVGSDLTGFIRYRNDDGTYTVDVSAPRGTINGVRIALPVLGGLCGFNIRCKLAPGTQVKMMYGKPTFIYAVIPKNDADWKNAVTRSLLWGLKDNNGDNFTGTPEDMVEGEFEINNDFGVSMDFLTSILRMNAGDRAKVECHLINDMVRIISSQYRHFSGIGEELIFDHGRPTMERTWSSYRHELMGVLKEGDAFAALNGDEVAREEVIAEQATAVGRHRLVELIGFAGDFIHSFVTDPVDMARNLMGTGAESTGATVESGAGKSWIHRNSDGGVLIQSVTEIRLERVCRIPVPVRTVSHEDKDLTAAREYDKLQAEFLKLPDFGTREKKSAYKLAYHLRAYSRWLSRLHSFARVLQLSKEYKLKSEDQSPQPSWTNLEADKLHASPGTQYYDAYACITILRDGSIVIHDGYGGGVTMANGNVQVSAARHLELEAAGDIRLVAGGSVYVKARRNIELSAAIGGIILHSYAWMRAMCEKGSLWLRSGAATGPGATLAPARADGPLPEVVSNAEAAFAVLIEAPAGGVAVRSDKQVLVAIEGEPVVPSGKTSKDVSTHDFMVATKGNVRSYGDNTILYASRDTVVTSKEAMAVTSNSMYCSIPDIDLGMGVTIKGGVITAPSLRSMNLYSNAIYGPEAGPWKRPDDVSPGVNHHLNHIWAWKEPVSIVFGTDAGGLEALTFAKKPPATFPRTRSVLPWSSNLEGHAWGFCSSGEYYWDPRDENTGTLAESLTQQFARLDTGSGDFWGGEGYGDWDWSQGLLEGPRVGLAAGFGFKAEVYQSSLGENLHAPLSYNYANFDPLPDISWELAKPFKFKFLKRPTT